MQNTAEHLAVLEMVDESRECMMSLELAIQRELAYRREIFLSQLQAEDDFKEDPTPLQVLSSSPSASPTRSPSPRSHSNPSPSLSGVKREAASSSYECLLPPWPQSLNSHPMHPNQTEVIYCSICNVPCYGSYNYKQHLDGQKHKAKLEELKLARSDVNPDSKAADQRRWCKLCNTGCTNAELFKQHLHGKKHKAMAEKLKYSQKDNGEIAKQPKQCKLCDLWCPNEEQYMMHLEGKRHIARLHEIKNRRPKRVEL